MSVSLQRLRLGFVAVVCLFHSSAFADRIYQLPMEKADRATSMRALSNVFANAQVVDSIPQLGIVVTRTAIAGANDLTDLGDVGTVHLIAPKASLSMSSMPWGLWGLSAIEVEQAWKITKGAGVIVAVSDTGVTANHKELNSQMWRNPGEAGTDSHGRAKSSNGVDDDGNGYVDDVYGWNFVKKKGGGVDNHYHGTHVAGTIAASVSKSMAGIAPSARIMDVSFIDKDGKGSDVDGAKTIVYAVDQGAKVINCSWGGDEKNEILEKAIQYAEDHGVLVIAAAGNDGQNNDKHTFAPSSYDYSNIISVGATSSPSGSVASFSNYGKKTVDLAAPGEEIYSLAPNNGHQTLSGTSMATPHVSGVAALVWSAHPRYSASQVKKALMAVKTNSAWSKKCVSGGTLDAPLAVTH